MEIFSNISTQFSIIAKIGYRQETDLKLMVYTSSLYIVAVELLLEAQSSNPRAEILHDSPSIILKFICFINIKDSQLIVHFGFRNTLFKALHLI
jgi:hypothetical protein